MFLESWWKNNILDKKLKIKRMNICNDCNSYDWSLRICNKCGCFIPLKSLLKNSTCPNLKW